MERKELKTTIIFVCFILTSGKTFAARGLSSFGWHSGAFSDNIWNKSALIIVIIVLITAATSLVFLKSIIADRIIRRSAIYDPIWNVEELKSHARNLFFNLSKALSDRDISSLTDNLTPDLYHKQQTIISELIQNKQVNILKILIFRFSKLLVVKIEKIILKTNILPILKGEYWIILFWNLPEKL
ncbi:MAG: hypothetical protein QM800_11345 [Paludibacter sp.]